MAMEDRMANVEQSLVRIETTLTENLPKMTKQLSGNGTEDPGMIVRVDRLEQSAFRQEQTSQRTRWVIRIIVATISTIFLAGLWSLLTE